MILRKFIQHVSEQNWIAVGLDICVVVIGIFIGLQVSEWNGERELRIQEREYIERLHVYADQNVKTLEQAASVHTSLLDSQIKVIQLLSLPELDEDQSNLLASNILSIAFWRAIDLDTGLIESLISSGRIELIRNNALQEALIKSSTSVLTLNSQLDHFRGWYSDLQPNFLNIIEVVMQVDSLSSVDATSTAEIQRLMNGVSLGDDEKLLASKELKSIIFAMTACRSNFRTMLLGHLEQARETEKLLASELKKLAV